MEILERVKSSLPKGVVGKIELEGSEIIVYTKDKDFFLSCEDVVRDIVSQLKKRIEVRPQADICLDAETAKKIILEIVPEDAKVREIYFEPERSLVIISAEKPGRVIGKGGETFKEIKRRTFWVPRIERVPPIKSDVIEGIRRVLHTEVKFRKNFLNKVGENIFTERKTNRDWIRIIGLGGWREVGRSCILLETSKSKVLIDCGVNVGGTDVNMLPIFHTKEFDYNELDAVIISHAHLDHCGALPMLYEYGYDGPLYLTTPTIDLATLLWLDYIDVMQRSMVKPLFSVKGVKDAVKHAITLEYGEVADVAPDVRLTFENAGHILGSALVHLHIGEGLYNILYALDQKFGRTTLLEPATTNFQRVEALIIESTYGGPEDIMPKRSDVERQLLEVINKTMERNGIALLPTFAVERAQEVMAILVKNNFQYPVYIDGMIWDANGIFTAYPEYLSRGIRREIFAGEDPFLNPMFKRIASGNEREKAWEDRPCVIISTSGMLVGGPVIEHLKVLAEDERNTLIFCGYQCVDGNTEVSLTNGKTEKIKNIFNHGKKLLKTENIEIRNIAKNIFGLDLSTLQLKNSLAPLCGRRRYEGEIIRILTEDGKELLLSSEHPVLTQNLWKKADRLTKNDKLWTVEMKPKLVKIKKIERLQFNRYLYDITSLPHHNFLANGIVSHNCEGTMGRRIQKGWREIPFKIEEGKTVTLPLKMEVQTIDGLSGHSDRNQLLAYIGRLTARPEKVIVLHGENQKAMEFAKSVQRIFRIDTIAPRNLEAIRLK